MSRARILVGFTIVRERRLFEAAAPSWAHMCAPRVCWRSFYSPSGRYAPRQPIGAQRNAWARSPGSLSGRDSRVTTFANGKVRLRIQSAVKSRSLHALKTLTGQSLGGPANMMRTDASWSSRRPAHVSKKNCQEDQLASAQK